MTTYCLSKRFPWQGPLSKRGIQLCRMFGLTIERLADRIAIHQCRLKMRPGDIVYIMGPSGAGKSVLLRELEQAVPPGESVNLANIPLAEDRSVIDCFDDDVVRSLRLLGAMGLSEVFCLLNRPCNLSDGQKYRFRLAQALASGKSFVFADEFSGELDRVTAAAVAFNIHRFAKRTRTTFILASSHEDVLMDLVPDVLVVKDFTGPAEVIYRSTNHDP
ncbi:MAG: ATP-binding cassette domain-containing protein [Sedimentisphaerales bacterium]|nr:ATP-binding cassette domain-containing protein [Sedimentisphaerales bacterium]